MLLAFPMSTKLAPERPVELDGLRPDEVRAHLDEVLASPSFRSSQRSQQFLRCVVVHALDGHVEALKERLIGEEIFGRPVDYDTGQDSIVRVKANEVRRRLSQFYESHPDSVVRIDMPSGSYAPHFRSVPRTAVEVATPLVVAELPARDRRVDVVGNAFGAVAIVAVAAWALWPAPAATALETFWQPFLAGSRDLTICLPTPEAFRIYGSDRDALAQALRPRRPGEPAPVLKAAILDDVKIVPEPGLLVGLGDARTLTLVHSFLTSKGKATQLRLGNVTTFSELRAGPSVLIGGFTNPWTIDLTREHRFVFSSAVGSPPSIRDTKTGKVVCQKPPTWEPRGTEDCAIVTRMIDSKTGHPVLIAAGLDHFGTFAAGEFLTRPKLLEPALAQAEAGWAAKNIQIVFRVEKVQEDVGPPAVLAVHTW